MERPLREGATGCLVSGFDRLRPVAGRTEATFYAGAAVTADRASRLQRAVDLGPGSREMMGLITSLHGDIADVSNVCHIMHYTVTFYALRAGLSEATVAARRIGDDALLAYTGSPDTAMASIRKSRTATAVDGFRILDERGQSIFDFLDMRRFR